MSRLTTAHRLAIVLGLLLGALGAWWPQLPTPVLPAAAPPAAQPELVRIIVQTERSIQLQRNDDAIEVATAVGWPTLQLPVVVCVHFDRPPDPIHTRAVRLRDRSACP